MENETGLTALLTVTTAMRTAASEPHHSRGSTVIHL